MSISLKVFTLLILSFLFAVQLTFSTPSKWIRGLEGFYDIQDQSQDKAGEDSSDRQNKGQEVLRYSSSVHGEYEKRFHQFENLPHSESKKIWDSRLGIGTDEEWESVDLYKNLRDDIQVLGWHPYWAEDAQKMYDYETLSIISYFGYSFNYEDGTGINQDRWNSTTILDKAHRTKDSIKLLLTVYSYDEPANKEFLGDPDAMMQLVDDVTGMIDQKEAHGITLDFQNIPKTSANNYVELVQLFSEQMAPKNQMITVVVPPVDPDSTIAVDLMVDIVDYVIMMGYDFHGEGEIEGPFSVLYDLPEEQTSSIESGVNRLLAYEEGVPAEKILVSLGWIGSLFGQTNDSVDTRKHKGYRSYGYMKNQLSDNIIDSDVIVINNPNDTLTVNDDKPSRSNSISYPGINSDADSTFHFDNTRNFGHKLDWIQNQGLGGVAIWTLADAGNGDEYWKVIVEKFGRPPLWIVNYVINPAWEFFVEEWLHPYLSLYISIFIIALTLFLLIFISMRKDVPGWLSKFGVFLPAAVFSIIFFSLCHDLYAHYAVEGWDDPVYTSLSLGFGSVILLISTWYCYRVYHLDRKRVP